MQKATITLEFIETELHDHWIMRIKGIQEIDRQFLEKITRIVNQYNRGSVRTA